MVQPPFAALDSIGARPLVQPALATLLEFEMFDCICNEYITAGNASRGQSLIEDTPAGPTKGLPAIFSLFPGCSPTSIS
jgi:hypothetical protein